MRGPFMYLRKSPVLVVFLAVGMGCRGNTPPVAPKFEGVWSVDLDSKATGVQHALWDGTRLRVDKLGKVTFYGPLDAAGRYEVGGTTAKITLTRFLGTEIEHWHDNVNRFPILKVMKMPEPQISLRWDNGALFADLPANDVGEVRFARHEPESVAALLKVVAEAGTVNADSAYAIDELTARKRQAVPELIDQLDSHASFDVRWWAILFLCQAQDPRGIPALRKVLHDPDQRLRQGVWTRMSEDPQPGLFTDMLELAKANKSNPYSVGHVFRAYGDPRAVPMLRSYLVRKSLGKSDGLGRAAIIAALAECGGVEALPDIRKWETSADPNVAVAATLAIVRLDPKGIDRGRYAKRVGVFLRDPNWMVRCDAAKALGTLGDRSAGPLLVTALGDSWAPVRRESAKALGSMRYVPARADLERLTQDDDEQVRTAARKALRLLP